MNKIERKSLFFLSIIMGIWLLSGSILFLFCFPKNLLIMIHYTLSLYFFIFVGIVFYFLTKKAISDLAETGLGPQKKKKKK